MPTRTSIYNSGCVGWMISCSTCARARPFPFPSLRLAAPPALERDILPGLLLPGLRQQDLQVRHHVRHGRPLPRVLVPHAFDEAYGLFPPLLHEASYRRAVVLLPDRIVYVMLIVPLPRVFLSSAEARLRTWRPHASSPSRPPIPRASPNTLPRPRTHPPCNRTAARGATALAPAS